MLQRKRSKDSTKESDTLVHDAPAPGQLGRLDDYLKRKVGTRDELQRVRRAGDATNRTRKSDKEGEV